MHLPIASFVCTSFELVNIESVYIRRFRPISNHPYVRNEITKKRTKKPSRNLLEMIKSMVECDRDGGLNTLVRKQYNAGKKALLYESSSVHLGS